MKTLLLYRSKSGFTKSYVEYISNEIECDILENKNITLDTLKDYDTIIFGGGLYISGINGIKTLSKNFDSLKEKNLIVFFVGATPGRDNEIKDVINKNFSITEQKAIKFFYFRGGFNFGKLKFIDKILMTLLKFKLRLKSKKTSDEQGMLNSYRIPLDFTSKEKIIPLVTYVKSLS